MEYMECIYPTRAAASSGSVCPACSLSPGVAGLTMSARRAARHYIR